MYKLRRYIVFILLFQFIPGSLILLKTRSSSPDPTTITRPHAIAADEDWLVLTADSFIQEEPDPTSLRWYWRWGVLMYGLWKAYGTTGDSNYLDYIRSYVDHYVPLNGNITSHLHPTEALNRVIPAALLPLLYEETLEQKYLTATQIVADYVMDDCDRTAEGGLISTKDWLMLDGVYMGCVFLSKAGLLLGQPTLIDEAVFQILHHAGKLQDPNTGLFYHAWDEDGSEVWSDPVFHRSPCFWGRGNGWMVMAIVEILDCMPSTHPQRDAIVQIFEKLITGICTVQDQATGLWYTVLDKGGQPDNYLETSASAMFVYAIEKGVLDGIIDPDFRQISIRGDQALNSKASLSQQDLVTIHDISDGTSIGDYNYYVSIPTLDNLPYGIGAFLLAKSLHRSGLAPPARVTDISIGVIANGLSVSWPHVTSNTQGSVSIVESYTLYRCEDFRFLPAQTDSVPEITETSYFDNTPGVVGNPDRNVFFRIKAFDTDGVSSSFSDIYGAWDYQLVTTPQTDFNFVSSPFIQEHIENASSLLACIPGCNSVAVWKTLYQGYEQYIPSILSTNFSLAQGEPFFANIVEDTVISLTGVLFNPSYHLQTTHTTDFNPVIIPLDKSSITMASHLLADIPGCDGVAVWDPYIQTFLQYTPQLTITDFSVRAGYPYLVNITNDVIWPGESGTPMKDISLPSFQIVPGPTSAPHIVWGRHDLTTQEKLQMTAYISSRPEEILDENSPGCRISKDHWYIQCCTFPSPWKAGQTLNVEIRNGKKILKRAKCSLTYSVCDEAVSIGAPFETDLGLSLECHPNPSNDAIQVVFHLEEKAFTNVVVFNLFGQRIRNLQKREQPPGSHRVQWDGRDENGNLSPSGMYVISCVAGSAQRIRKVCLVR